MARLTTDWLVPVVMREIDLSKALQWKVQISELDQMC